MYGQLRLRSVMTIVVAVWVFVGVAGCCWLVQLEPSESTPAQAFSISLRDGFAVNADHVTADCAVCPACPQTFAMAVLPPSATALVALGTAMVVTIVGSGAHGAVPARRGSPRGVLVALSGQDVLTRFCLARR
jgi:hypothetical protein